MNRGQRTEGIGQRRGLRTVGRRARLFAFVLCPLSFVLATAAQAADHAITVNVGETTAVQTYQYRKNNVVQERWFKLAGGDGATATAQFAQANPEESRMSASSCELAEFTFTGVKAGTTTWTICTYTDAPPYKSGKSYPAYGTADGTTGSWTGKDTFTITVVQPAEPPVDPPPVDPADPTQMSYTGDVEKKTVDGEEVYVFKSGTCTLTLPQDVLADILVVGGGGAGAKGSSGKYGSSGNGGKGTELTNAKMPAGTYAIAVGAGGQSACAAGGASSIGGVAGFTAIERAGASALTDSSSHSSNYKAGSDGYTDNNGYSDITGESLKYGAGGAKASSGSGKHGTAGAANTGNGGVGGYNSSNDFGAGGSGVVIVRILRERTKIAVPTAAQGLVWGMTNQVGVAAGEGYVRGGTCEASAFGEYTATVTPDDDHCWPDLSRDTRTIRWKIARRPAKVTVIDATKAPNDPEPRFRTKNEGFLAADQAELVWTAWRTNTDEAVGTYDVVILGEREQSGYDIDYVGGALTIAEKPVGPTVVPVADLTKAIYGAEPEEIRIVSQTGVDITSAFTLSGNAADGVTATLNRAASVAFELGDGKAETIAVTPTLTDVGDETVEPLEVGESEVNVGVKTIPGLTYALRRGDEPGKAREGKVVDEKQAEGLRTKLTDPMDGGKPPQAFYIIEARK